MKIFPLKLSSLLETGIVKIFQLRLKGYNDKLIIEITKYLYQICRHYNVVFILNDRPDIAKITGVDGVHLGDLDCSIKKARAILGNNKIIGSSCYNNILNSIKSQSLGADYIAYGAFFKTKTKEKTKTIFIPNLKKHKKNIKCATVGIGGLNKSNIKKIAFLKFDFLAFCSSIWYGKNIPTIEIRNVKKVLDSF